MKRDVWAFVIVHEYGRYMELINGENQSHDSTVQWNDMAEV